MELSVETLRSLLSKAFDLGYEHSAEFRQELIEELLINIPQEKVDEFRVYKTADLRKMPEGTLFQHSTRGRCWIVVKPDGTKAMQFQKDNAKIGIQTDNEPWDRPMKLMHSESV